MRLPTFAFIALTFLALDPLAGRPIIGGKSFQEMFDKADLVIIATARKTKDTPEKKKLINIQPEATHNLNPDELQGPVIGVETDFRVRLCLKGAKDIKWVTLHHYRLPEEGSIANGPAFLLSNANRKTFLMFLVKEKDGRYAPVTGQFDPAELSVLQLNDAIFDSLDSDS